MGGAQEPWNMKQWAESHEQLDQTRFSTIHATLRLIIGVLGLALTVLLAITGWSLKTNYDTQATAIAEAQETRHTVTQSSQAVIQSVQGTNSAQGH